MTIENKTIDEKNEQIITQERPIENPVVTKEELLKRMAEIKAQLDIFKNESDETIQKGITRIDTNVAELGVSNPEELSFIKTAVGNLENQKQDKINMSRAELEALMIEEAKEKPIEPSLKFATLVEDNAFKNGVENEQKIASDFYSLLNEKPPEKKLVREQHFDQTGNTKIYEVEGREYDEYSPEIKNLDINKLEWKT